MAKYVIWSDCETDLMAMALVAYLRDNGKDIGALYTTGMFSTYAKLMQQPLPADRRRNLLGWSGCPVILAKIRKEMGESATPSNETVPNSTVADFVRKHLDEVLAVLSETHHVHEKTARVRLSLPEEPARQVKQRILICGLKPNQANEVTKLYGTVFDLRFASGDNFDTSSSLRAASVIGVVGFLSHSVDEHLRTRYKSRYVRVIGATASVLRTLDSYVKGRP